MRTRYIQDSKTGRLIEVPKDYKPPPRKTPAIHTDIEPFVSPVDGRIIESKRALRMHNKENDVIDVREWGNKSMCNEDAKREREQKILGTHKETNEQRKKAVVDAYNKHTGSL